jgi:hypothetical protein
MTARSAPLRVPFSGTSRFVGKKTREIPRTRGGARTGGQENGTAGREHIPGAAR